MKADEPWPDLEGAAQRVQRMQTKLHQWAAEDPGRRFADLFNLICHPDFLTVAWDRVRGNKGARTAGVDRVVPAFLSGQATIEAFLASAREQLRSRMFIPLPVRERLIPKPGRRGQFRRLGIPAAMDRLVQASLVLVLEPIFEADFKPVSYGFRPRRRCQDAIAEIHRLGTRGYHWVFEADITACFDEIDHTALMGRVRRRVADKRVLALIKAFLKAGIMAQDGHVRDSITGTPQGGIASPLLANIALSALDEHFCAKWDAHGDSSGRYRHRKRGGATYRIVRYADDLVIMVHGSKAHAEVLWEEVAGVLAPLGLRLAAAKSRVCHLDEGFDFLGFRIQRRRKKGTSKHYVYTYPSKQALRSITARVWALTSRSRHKTLTDLLRQLNWTLRGWCNYFRHGVSAATFRYLDLFAWRRVTLWLRKRHVGINWKVLYRRFLTGRARPPSSRGQGGAVPVPEGRGHPLPLARRQHPHTMGERPSHSRIASGNPWSAGCSETGTSGAEGGPGNQTGRDPGTAPRSDPYTKLLGPAKWTWFYLYVVIDIYSRYVPGWMLARAERAQLAERLLAEAIAKQQVSRDQLTIHADRGTSMASKPVAFLLADLGVTKSHSRPHCSNDNPYSESQFKTLKHRPEFPNRFGCLEDAHAFCTRFFRWYNQEHRHSGIGFYTPADVHYGRAELVQAQRARVLEAAYAAHPERFVRKPPAPPELPTAAWINKPEEDTLDTTNS